MREHLKRQFAYDLWANSLWAEVIDQINGGKEVLSHIAECHHCWLARCLNEADAESAGLDPQKLNSAWLNLIEVGDPTAFVVYAIPGGTVFNTLQDVAQHVLYHGAYHRGHLRQLAESQGIEFPETDYDWFCELNS